MIKTESFTSIAKKFGVSDNAIRKWCDRYNLPRTKREIKKADEFCKGYKKFIDNSPIEREAVRYTVELAKKAGFTEYGRNPRGFRSRTAGYQELVYMRLEM